MGEPGICTTRSYPWLMGSEDGNSSLETNELSGFLFVCLSENRATKPHTSKGWGLGKGFCARTEKLSYFLSFERI